VIIIMWIRIQVVIAIGLQHFIEHSYVRFNSFIDLIKELRFYCFLCEKRAR